MAVKYLHHMSIKYANIFHCKTLQNLPRIDVDPMNHRLPKKSFQTSCLLRLISASGSPSAVFSASCVYMFYITRGLKPAMNRVARFILVQHTKTGRMNQMTTKYIKWLYVGKIL
jgi:hypothetical protein